MTRMVLAAALTAAVEAGPPPRPPLAPLPRPRGPRAAAKRSGAHRPGPRHGTDPRDEWPDQSQVASPGRLGGSLALRAAAGLVLAGVAGAAVLAGHAAASRAWEAANAVDLPVVVAIYTPPATTLVLEDPVHGGQLVWHQRSASVLTVTDGRDTWEVLEVPERALECVTGARWHDGCVGP